MNSVRLASINEVPPGHNTNPPVLIHCNEGGGKSGVTLASDLLLYTLDHNQVSAGTLAWPCHFSQSVRVVVDPELTHVLLALGFGYTACCGSTTASERQHYSVISPIQVNLFAVNTFAETNTTHLNSSARAQHQPTRLADSQALVRRRPSRFPAYTLNRFIGRQSQTALTKHTKYCRFMSDKHHVYSSKYACAVP